MKLKSNLLFFVLILISATAAGESYKVKKLKVELSATSLPAQQIDLLIEIANEIKGSFPDSALYYFAEAEKLTVHLKTSGDKEVAHLKLMLGRASVEVAKGNYDQAWMLDSMALLKAQHLKNPKLEAQALMSKGGIYYRQAEYEKSQDCNNEALRIIRTTDDRKTEGKILTNMGSVEFIFGNAAKADSLFKIPLKLAEESNDEDLLAASLLNIGLLNIYKGEYETAENYLAKSAEIYETIDGKDGLVLCYQNLSNIWFEKGDVEKAIEFNLLNYNLSTELDDKAGLAKACQNLGECHSQIGDYEKALEYLIRSANIKSQLGDSKGIAASNASIGHIHYLQDHFIMALEYYRKSLKTNIEIGYEMGIAAGYGNIASIYNEQNQQDSTLYYFEKAAEIYEKNEAVNYLANVYLNIGKMYFTRKDLTNAEKYYSKAEEIKTQLDDKIGLYNTWALLTSLYYTKSLNAKVQSPAQNSDLNTSLFYGKKAYDLAVSSNNLTGQREAAGYLKDIYAELKNPEEALKYANIKMEISDSLNLKQRADALVNAEIRWKAEKRQVEIDRLERQKSLQEEVIQQKSALANRLTILIVVILLLLILMIAASFLFMKNKAKQKAIEYQNHVIEITRLKMQNINNRLSPHLFFNLLNSVSEDAGDTSKVKEKLGQAAFLLRTSLENTEHTAITIARELEMVKAYISLQSSRLPDTFKADFKISEAVDLNTQIPSMMLQIPVENAIKHGLLPLEGEKRLTVSIEKSGQTIILKIDDNGIGRKNSQGRTTGTGTGLKVLLQTIRLLNKQNNEQIIFTINDKEPQGTEVEIIVPEKFNYAL